MKKPNFFIIGAPKCGTTSMAAWLAEHPNIYMSRVKEPNFFNTDDKLIVTRSLRQYEALFRSAGQNHIAVGEASAWYLFSEQAIPHILEHVEKPKFIVMVRNPVEMAYSLHQQEVYSRNEHIRDFQVAWALQLKRAKGFQISRYCVSAKRLLYGPACTLGEQVERLYSFVPKKRVLVLVLDDVKENARREYLRVLKFLGVPDDGRMNFHILNPAKTHRLALLGRMLNLLSRGIGRSKRFLGIQGGFGILEFFIRANRVERPRVPLDNQMKGKLALYFKDDVVKLSKLLERDLSSWLEFDTSTSKKNVHEKTA